MWILPQHWSWPIQGNASIFLTCGKFFSTHLCIFSILSQISKNNVSCSNFAHNWDKKNTLFFACFIIIIITRGMFLLTKAKHPWKFKMLCGFNKHAVKLRMHKAALYTFPIPLNTFWSYKSNDKGDIRQKLQSSYLWPQFGP